jgi:hypothetical protein
VGRDLSPATRPRGVPPGWSARTRAAGASPGPAGTSRPATASRPAEPLQGRQRRHHEQPPLLSCLPAKEPDHQQIAIDCIRTDSPVALSRYRFVVPAKVGSGHRVQLEVVASALVLLGIAIAAGGILYGLSRCRESRLPI